MKKYAVHGTRVVGFLLVMVMLLLIHTAFASVIMDSGKCGPGAECNRGQILTFLYRALAE